jgi:hypothetical protein
MKGTDILLESVWIMIRKRPEAPAALSMATNTMLEVSDKAGCRKEDRRRVESRGERTAKTVISS